jgi:hypothetical protein
MAQQQQKTKLESKYDGGEGGSGDSMRKEPPIRGPDRNRNLSLAKGTLEVEGLAEFLLDAAGGGGIAGKAR